MFLILPNIYMCITQRDSVSRLPPEVNITPAALARARVLVAPSAVHAAYIPRSAVERFFSPRGLL